MLIMLMMLMMVLFDSYGLTGQGEEEESSDRHRVQDHHVFTCLIREGLRAFRHTGLL